jgi:hypothetical protein
MPSLDDRSIVAGISATRALCQAKVAARDLALVHPAEVGTTG